jgi:hypothetical protein
VSKHEVRIGAGDWWEDNPKRFGIYNANYIGNFEKVSHYSKPWRLATPNGHGDQGKKFPTQEAAATYLREEVLNKCAST